MCIRDRYYNEYCVLNAPENMTVDVSLITNLSENMCKYAKAIRCSNTTEVTCKLISNRILANHLTPSSPHNSELLFYLYSDEYCYRLLAIIYIDVRAYSCLNLGGIASKRIETSVEFTNRRESTQIELQANNEERLEIDSHCINPLDAPSTSSITIPLTIKSSRTGKSTVLLHCFGNVKYNIDYNTKEVLSRWMFRLNLSAPKINYKYKVKAPIGEVSRAGFIYQNESGSEHIYEFAASHPEIASLETRSAKLKPGEKASVQVILKPMEKPKQAQILIFVEETESCKCEALLFIISYVL
eukprot:TRINITY_DN12993_c0_g1_i1.p1 TRINITY_DN12993_c0_g1~~TRINITY_DN12993_c0_g1_i1.p1  ORF type:complete len:299 (-),score=55.31 TRINITY_DN12993_c0_g1_i1:110-1006(-)